MVILYGSERGYALWYCLAFGQNWRDIASWNNLIDPDKIKIGRKLRLCQKIPETRPSIPLKSASRDPLDKATLGESEVAVNERALDDALLDDSMDRDEEPGPLWPGLAGKWADYGTVFRFKQQRDFYRWRHRGGNFRSQRWQSCLQWKRFTWVR